MADAPDGDRYPKTRRNILFDYFRKITNSFTIRGEREHNKQLFLPSNISPIIIQFLFKKYKLLEMLMWKTTDNMIINWTY